MGASMAIPDTFADTKVVLQISEPNPFKQTLVLNVAGNVLMHYGDTSKVDIEVAAFGPGARLLMKDNANTPRIKKLMGSGVRFSICNNTLTNLSKKLGYHPEIIEGVYWSTAYLLGGGKKAFRHEVKGYLWRQSGKRFYNGSDHNRTREGVGLTYFNGKYRLMTEYIKADGMVFNGLNPLCGAGSTSSRCVPQTYKFNAPLTDGKAEGWYVDVGYIINPRWDVAVRYDSLDRGTNIKAAKQEFRNWTLADQYHFNKKRVSRSTMKSVKRTHRTIQKQTTLWAPSATV